MKVGVCVGRFQVPELHGGHLDILDWVAENTDLLVVVLGVARSEPNYRNPMDFVTRRRMIQEFFPGALILAITDEKSDQVWSDKLDLLVGSFGGVPTMYGSRDSFLSHYLGKYEKYEITERDIPDLDTSISGTQLRKAVTQPLHTSEFREGVIYTHNNARHRVFPTVDIIVKDLATNRILVGQKPGEDKWRFPGGFVDPEDQNLEQAAARELKEETGLEINQSLFTYISSQLINDWRYQDKDQIMTTLFGVSCYVDQTAIAGDDLAQLRWVDMADPSNHSFSREMVSSHQPLFFNAFSFIKNNKSGINPPSNVR